MKVKTRVTLVLILLALAVAATVVAGCKIGEMTISQFLKDKDRSVTYYANGGYFDGMNTLYTKNLYYTADYPEVIVDFDKSQMSITRLNYIFDGWYLVELDEEGNPQFINKDRGEVELTGEVFDTPRFLEKDEHLYLGAKWKMDSRVEVVLVTDDGGSVTAKNDDGTTTEYANKDVIDYKYYGTASTVNISNGSAPSIVTSEYTFFGYYQDEACETPFEGSMPKPASPEDENYKVYAKYIKGEWEMVRTATDVFNMMINLAGGKNFYIMDDIDCSKLAAFTAGTECNSVIEGNGCTISNLKYQLNISASVNTGSMFGKLTEGASIRNITFDTVTGSVTLRNDMSSLYLLASADNGADGSMIDNVTVKNATFTIVKAATITVTNIPLIDEEYKTDNWIGGGFNTDEEFLNNFSGLTVENATLLIGTRASNAVEVAAYNATQTD